MEMTEVESLREQTSYIRRIEEITQITQINRDLLKRIEGNFLECLQKCLNENGHHMPDLIFRT